MIRVTTNTSARTLEQDMTTEELALLDGPLEGWGDAEAAASRGAAYLDRVLPGWADRVIINELHLDDVCHCVLGQLFTREARQVKSEYFSTGEDSRTRVVLALGNGEIDIEALESGYSLGLELLGLGKREAEEVHVRLTRRASAAHFFGFDHTLAYDYWQLTDAWKPLIESRQPVTA